MGVDEPGVRFGIAALGGAQLVAQDRENLLGGPVLFPARAKYPYTVCHGGKSAGSPASRVRIPKTVLRKGRRRGPVRGLIVGGNDTVVLELNRRAQALSPRAAQLRLVLPFA